jgi:Zn-dependent peptidase ImmA (M78 family)
MTGPSSHRDIEKISYDILKNSRAWDVLPTPVDKIVDFTELVVNNSLDISTVHESYLHRASDALFKALSKVRGLLDREQKTIYLDLSQLPTKKNFVTLHEVGHDALPWQKMVHDVIEDDDDSLGSHVTEEFEAEANYFASVTLFQHDRFVSEINKLNLGMESAMHLSKLFGASVHATLRNYVESSSKRCALLVLEKISEKGSTPKCFKRNYFTSQKFTQEFGNIEFPNEFGYKWGFAKDYYFRKRGIVSGNISLTTENGVADFKYQFFNNSYNGFVFLYPIGEKQSSKTIIIVSESYK